MLRIQSGKHQNLHIHVVDSDEGCAGVTFGYSHRLFSEHYLDGDEAGAAPAARELRLIAGSTGGSGFVDGNGTQARFEYPLGMAIDRNGAIFVADFYANTIGKITPDGTVATFAGAPNQSGSQDGIGAAARFDGPTGLAIDDAGNLYLTDTFNNTIRKISPDGTVSTLAGTVGEKGGADGRGNSARFNFPQGIAIDHNGIAYVSDTYNNTIRRIMPDGTVTTLAGMSGQRGSTDGAGHAASFDGPTGIAVEPNGNILVCDAHNYTVRRITPAGIVSTAAGTAGVGGLADGAGAQAQFGYPTGIFVDNNDTAYIVDSINNTIRVMSPSAVVSTLAGTAGVKGSADGFGPVAKFNYPVGVTVAPSGAIYIADSRNHTVRTVTATGAVTTLAGASANTGDADGVGADAQFNAPTGVAADAAGNLYLADTANNTVRRIDTQGNVTTIAGAPGEAGAVDGYGISARFNGPSGIAVSDDGTVYVADTFNSTIRMISPQAMVTTLAGVAGEEGSGDGAATQARFNRPAGLALRKDGALYVADSYNNTIRRIDPDGAVTTVAGIAGTTGGVDGDALAATFSNPLGVIVAADGTLYIGDGYNNTIRGVSSQGKVFTVAGTAGTVGYHDGTGAWAGFDFPSALALSKDGGLLVCDTDNQIVRKITPAGVVTTYLGQPKVSAIELGSLPGGLTYPVGIATSGDHLVIVSGNAVLMAPLP